MKIPILLSIALVAAGCAFFANSAAGQTYSASIQSIAHTGTDNVIDADSDMAGALYNRDRVFLSATTQFNRTFAGSSTPSFRYRVRLVDGGGTPVLLKTSGGATATSLLFPISINWGSALSVIVTSQVNVSPAEQLSTETLYALEAVVQQETSPGSWTTLGSGISGYRRYWHFTGTDPLGPEFNVRARIQSLQFSKTHALATGADLNQRSFRAEAEIEIRRYDGWTLASPGTDSILFRLTNRLAVNVLGTVIPLEPEGNGIVHTNVPLPQFSAHPDLGFPEPHRRIITVSITLVPAQQLETVNREFLVRSDLAHVEILGSRDYVADRLDFPGQSAPLLHFNGDLRAVGTGAVFQMTRISSLSGATLGGGDSYWSATVNVTDGHLKLNPNFTMDPSAKSGISCRIRLLNDGIANLVSGEIPIAIPKGQEVAESGGHLRFSREQMRFGTAGIKADIALLLPEGMGVREFFVLSNSRFALGRLEKTDHNLVPGFLQPNGPVVFVPTAEAYAISEETKPFEVLCSSLSWGVLTGTLTPGPTPAGLPRIQYVREAEHVFLEAAPLLPAEKILRSNAGYYAFLTGATTEDPVFTADEKGNGQFSGGVALGSGSFRTHFPYDARLAWSRPSEVAFVDDLPVPTNSALEIAQAVHVPYSRVCLLTEALGCGTISDLFVELSPGSNPLRVTIDGGLSVLGSLTRNGQLQLGYISALTSDPLAPVFAHETTPFATGSFLSAGHFLSGRQYNGPADDGPAFLLNSGINPNNVSVAERPHTAAYATGTADYAGINYRVPRSGGPTAQSVLGGSASPDYALAERSKYYTRRSGVSGIHEPADNPFAEPIEIYGYEFEIENFALSFLSSEVRDSRTAGSLYIPDPAVAANGFTVAFDRLFFSCLGALTTAEIRGGPFDHTLAYWNADITALAASFTPKAGAECDPGEAFFTLGVRGHASNFAAALHGSLLFYPNGDLVPGSDPSSPPGRDSRLSPPSQLTFAGPGGETYHFTPLHGAFFNSHAQAGNTFNGTAQGFINLVGLLDVAFFRDLEVHIQTGARKDNITDTLHLMGGWTVSGLGFFNATNFDGNHRAYPPAANLAAYRNGQQAGWHIHAFQEWLDVVKFDYALSWDSAARAFRSRAPVTNDFLVLTTQHKLKHLSATTAEIDFGAALDLAVPEINLGALSQATPLYGALHDVADSLTELLLDGLGASERLLNDLVDTFFETVFAQTIDPITDALTDSLLAIVDDTDVQGQIDALLDPAFAALENQFNLAQNIAGTVNAAIDADLARMQQSVETVAGSSGFFANSGSPDHPEYALAKTVLAGVFQTADGATYANLLASIGAAALNDAINERLKERASTIEQVRASLMVVQSTLANIRAGGTLALEMERAFTTNPTATATLLDAARERIREALDPTTLVEQTAASLNQLIRTAIRDKFNASPLVGQFQSILRAYVYELDASMRSGIDSAFAQVNQVIIDLIDEFLPVGGPLREFLGDLAGSSAVGNIDGYARINGDALRTLRLDADFEFNFPDSFAFNGFLEINQLASSGSSTCTFGAPDDPVTEVRLGAENVKVAWMGKELRFNVATKFTFHPDADNRLAGMAGAFEMTGGKVNFEAFTIADLGAAAAFGVSENYLAAKVGIEFNNDLIYGGVFFGRTCSLEPLFIVDPEVASVLPAPNPTFTGIYAYGQAFIPIINVGCLLSLSGDAGVGIFAFAEDNTVGGKMLVGASARAICAVNVGGQVTLVGVKTSNDFNFAGSGRLYGSAGVKPLEVTFDKKVTLTYKNQKWKYDF